MNRQYVGKEENNLKHYIERWNGRGDPGKI